MLKFVELAHLLEQARSMEVEEEEHERVHGSVFSQVSFAQANALRLAS